MSKVDKIYTIIRTDLFPTQEDLQKCFDDYVAQNLVLEDEIKKLIDNGYIKKD
jgi:hypothetical protein